MSRSPSNLKLPSSRWSLAGPLDDVFGKAPPPIILPEELVGKRLVVYIDSDIPVFKTASVHDNKRYVVDGKEFKWAKEANAHCEACGLDWKKARKEVYKPAPFGVARKTLMAMMTNLWTDLALEAEQVGFEFCLGTGENFRASIFPNYKASRKDKRTPELLNPLKEYVIDHLDAITMDGVETDDILGIMANTEGPSNTVAVIASIDKDLLQIPGWHYNLDKREFKYVTKEEGFRMFCLQCLAGDSTDDIPGLQRVGLPTAERILKNAKTPQEMWDKVVEAWLQRKNKHKPPYDEPMAGLFTTAAMVYILRAPGEMFTDELEAHGVRWEVGG